MLRKNSGLLVHQRALKRQESMVEKVVVQGKECLRIPLTQGKSTIIEAESWPLVKEYKWCLQNNKNKQFYATSSIHIEEKNGIQRVRMHNVVSGLHYVDHINNDGLDNRLCNLRVCDTSQNSANRSKINGTTSKYKGVYWNKNSRLWYSMFSYKRKRIYLGCFDCEEDAGKAYDYAAKKAYGEFAKTNF